VILLLHIHMAALLVRSGSWLQRFTSCRGPLTKRKKSGAKSDFSKHLNMHDFAPGSIGSVPPVGAPVFARFSRT
jgi:hypothetical protein